MITKKLFDQETVLIYLERDPDGCYKCGFPRKSWQLVFEAFQGLLTRPEVFQRLYNTAAVLTDGHVEIHDHDRGCT